MLLRSFRANRSQSLFHARFAPFSHLMLLVLSFRLSAEMCGHRTRRTRLSLTSRRFALWRATDAMMHWQVGRCRHIRPPLCIHAAGIEREIRCAIVCCPVTALLCDRPVRLDHSIWRRLLCVAIGISYDLAHLILPDAIKLSVNWRAKSDNQLTNSLFFTGYSDLCRSRCA